MTDGWTEHRAPDSFDPPPRLVVTGDTRSPEELIRRRARRSGGQPLQVPIPSPQRKPWRPVAQAPRGSRRPRPRYLVLRLLLIVCGPMLVIAAALAGGRERTPPPPRPPEVPSPPAAPAG